jgi:hypothetical protein
MFFPLSPRERGNEGERLVNQTLKIISLNIMGMEQFM